MSIKDTCGYGSKTISDREFYESNELNPNFYRFFEMETQFPNARIFQLEIMNRNNLMNDFTIGEALIDLEDEFFGNY